MRILIEGTGFVPSDGLDLAMIADQSILLYIMVVAFFSTSLLVRPSSRLSSKPADHVLSDISQIQKQSCRVVWGQGVRMHVFAVDPLIFVSRCVNTGHESANMACVTYVDLEA